MTTLPSTPVHGPLAIPGLKQSWPLVIRETIQVGPVTVTRYAITDTMIRDGDPSATVLPRLVAADLRSFVFCNPEYTVTAPADVPLDRFLRQARHCLRRWLERVARVLGYPTQRKLMQACNLTDRMLRFTGALLIDGQPVRPGRWPDDPPLSEAKQRSRDRYERRRQQEQPYLTIGELLASARKAGLDGAHDRAVTLGPDSRDEDRPVDAASNPLLTITSCSTLVPVPETAR